MEGLFAEQKNTYYSFGHMHETDWAAYVMRHYAQTESHNYI